MLIKTDVSGLADLFSMNFCNILKKRVELIFFSNMIINVDGVKQTENEKHILTNNSFPTLIKSFKF